MRRAVLPLALALAASCGGAAKAPPAAPAGPPPDPPALVAVRSRWKAFVASAGSADDFDALGQTGATARARVQGGARAEVDLLLALAGLHLVKVHLDALDGADDLMAATLLPLTWGTRPLDGESAAAYRDRLCQEAAAAACAGALPDFWNAALVYAAAGELSNRAHTLAASCGCAARYQAALTDGENVAQAAHVHDTDRRPGWTLEADHLARSAFATPDWPPGDTRVPVKPAELLPARRKALAAKLTELRTAAPRPPDGAGTLLELEATTDAKLADVGALAAAARDAGFTALLFSVRVAAPPNPRGYLKVELAAARPPKGATTLSLAAGSKKGAMQSLVDQIDGAYGTSEAARVVLVVK
jgi:hypothetical protein